MTIDKTQISGVRFMFTVAFMLQSISVFTTFNVAIVKNDAWITVLIATIFFIPFIFLYNKLMLMFNNKNFVQMLETVFGKFIGKLLSIMFLYYLFTVTTLNLRSLGKFAKITVMINTPLFAIILVTILFSVFAVRHGLKVCTRYSVLFTIVEFSILVVSVVFLLDQIDLQNFLPIFEQPFLKYVQGVHFSMMIPIGELVIFLMITPNIRVEKKSLLKFWLWGLIIGISIFLIILMRDITVLGNLIQLVSIPKLIIFRLITIGDAISRIEILFVVAIMMLLFFKITLFLYITTITVAQIFEIKQFKNLALITGLLIAFYATVIYKSDMQEMELTPYVIPFFHMIFEIIIPLLLFIVAKIRGFPKKEQGNFQNLENNFKKSYVFKKSFSSKFKASKKQLLGKNEKAFLLQKEEK